MGEKRQSRIKTFQEKLFTLEIPEEAIIQALDFLGFKEEALSGYQVNKKTRKTDLQTKKLTEKFIDDDVSSYHKPVTYLAPRGVHKEIERLKGQLDPESQQEAATLQKLLEGAIETGIVPSKEELQKQLDSLIVSVAIHEAKMVQATEHVAALQALSLPLSDSSRDVLVDFIESCVEEDPSKRATKQAIDKVLSGFYRMLSQITSAGAFLKIFRLGAVCENCSSAFFFMTEDGERIPSELGVYAAHDGTLWGSLVKAQQHDQEEIEEIPLARAAAIQRIAEIAEQCKEEGLTEEEARLKKILSELW